MQPILTKRERNIVVLRSQKVPYDQICRMLGITRGQADYSYKQAMKVTHEYFGLDDNNGERPDLPDL